MITQFKVTWYPTTKNGYHQPPQRIETRQREEAEDFYQRARARKESPIMESREVTPWETVKQYPYDEQRGECPKCGQPGWNGIDLGRKSLSGCTVCGSCL